MKKALLYALILVISHNQVFCQGKTLLEDDFKNNENNWHLRSDSNFLVEIKNGSLHLEKFQKNFVQRGCLWYNKAIPGFNTLKNFSVTLYAKFLSGGDLFDKIDFQWGSRGDFVGGQKKDSLYQLDITFNGTSQFNNAVRLSYFNSNWNYFVQKKIKTLIDEDRFDPHNLNKYDIVQKDGFITLAINDTPYFKQQCMPIPGNSIGFQQCLKSAWEIDRIVVRQSGENVIATITQDTSHLISSADNESRQIQISLGLTVYPNPFKDILWVNFNLEKENTVKVFLIDMSGTTLQEHTKFLQQGRQQVMMYVDAPAGAYLLKTQIGNEKQIITKIIKL